MIVVAHRRNTVAELAATPTHLGVEVDVRPFGSDLVVAHDPFTPGPRFDTWLDAYGHALLVVNTKADGLLPHVFELLARHGIEDAFVLGPDPGEALPFWSAGEDRIAVRMSELHPPALAQAAAGHSGWVWLDRFFDGPSKTPWTPGVLPDLVDRGFKLCAVSPELFGREEARIGALQAEMQEAGVAFDAVCTRAWGRWG